MYFPGYIIDPVGDRDEQHLHELNKADKAVKTASIKLDYYSNSC